MGTTERARACPRDRGRSHLRGGGGRAVLVGARRRGRRPARRRCPDDQRVRARSVAGHARLVVLVAHRRRISHEAAALAAVIRASPPAIDGVCVVGDGSAQSSTMGELLDANLGSRVTVSLDLPDEDALSDVVQRIDRSGCGLVAWTGFGPGATSLRTGLTEAGSDTARAGRLVRDEDRSVPVHDRRRGRRDDRHVRLCRPGLVHPTGGTKVHPRLPITVRLASRRVRRRGLGRGRDAARDVPGGRPGSADGRRRPVDGRRIRGPGEHVPVRRGRGARARLGAGPRVPGRRRAMGPGRWGGRGGAAAGGDARLPVGHGVPEGPAVRLHIGRPPDGVRRRARRGDRSSARTHALVARSSLRDRVARGVVRNARRGPDAVRRRRRKAPPRRGSR